MANRTALMDPSVALERLTAAALGRAVAAGRLCPVALTEALFAKIAEHPAAGQVFARLMAPLALAVAVASRARADAQLLRSPLDGVPIAWKDNIDTAGVETEAGSALLRGRRPEHDAEVVVRLTSAGLPPIGKTHMTELAFSGLGINPITATPPNRFDPALCPGGSSSGSAVAVALGLAPLAIGTDTGGSIRLPAAWNNLVGFKPGHGRVPTAGVIPLAPRFDVVGPIARSVEDAGLAYALLAGVKPPDLSGASLAGATFAVLETVALDALDAAVAEGFEAALARVAHAGAKITRLSLPEVAEAMALTGILYGAECWALWGEQIAKAPELLWPPIRARFEGGARHNAAEYLRACNRLVGLKARFRQAIAGFDAILLPTVASLPPRVAPLEQDHAAFAQANLRALRNTRIANLMDCAALTLPTETRFVGLSLFAPSGFEMRLLRLGQAVERALSPRA